MVLLHKPTFIICYFLSLINLLTLLKGQSKHVELTINKNQLNLPIVSLCEGQSLLIDSGSQEVWMADHSCKQCYQTLSLCPYISDLSKQISYYKGKVRGDYIYMNTCFGQHKIICAKQLTAMQNIQAHGIIGIRGQSTGNSFLREYMRKNGVESQSIAVYYGVREGKIFLGGAPQEYRQEQIKIGKSQRWIFIGEQVKIAEKYIDIDCSVHFDTGSNVLILESTLYKTVVEQFAIMMEQLGCYTLSQNSYQCYHPIQLSQQMVFTFKNGEEAYLVSLQHLLNKNGTIHTLMLDKTDKNICILGIPAFRNYLIQFHMNGQLTVYRSSPNLSELQYSNYQLMLLEYVLLVVVLAVVGVRVASLVEEKIDRKIVI